MILNVIQKRPKELKGIKPLLTKVDKGYFYTKYELYKICGSLYISMSGYTMNKVWVYINNFKQYSAYELLALLWDYEDDPLPPRHLNDIILEFYMNNKLNLHKNEELKNWTWTDRDD